MQLEYFGAVFCNPESLNTSEVLYLESNGVKTTLISLILFGLSLPALAEREKVGDWHFDLTPVNGSYTATTYSQSGHYGNSSLSLSASLQQEGPCKIRLGYSLFGPYAISLKGKTAKARIDRGQVQRIRFHEEYSGRTVEGIKFSTGFIDLNDAGGKGLIADLSDGKWLRLRLDQAKVERFSLMGLTRAARAIAHFCQTPELKDRYPLEILLQKQDDDEYL